MTTEKFYQSIQVKEVSFDKTFSAKRYAVNWRIRLENAFGCGFF
jgi:hypothetical protein